MSQPVPNLPSVAAIPATSIGLGLRAEGTATARGVHEVLAVSGTQSVAEVAGAEVAGVVGVVGVDWMSRDRQGALRTGASWAGVRGIGLAVVVGWVGQALARERGLAVWIGRDVWPNPAVLGRSLGGGLLERSIFVDAKGMNLLVWAAELASRCEGVAAVVLDGRGLNLTATRRLQLAARSSRGAVFMLREGCEAKKPSAAGVRWSVCPVVSPGRAPRWRVEMLRCKGGQFPARVRPDAAFADFCADFGMTPGHANARDDSPAPANQTLQWHAATATLHPAAGESHSTDHADAHQPLPQYRRA